MRKLLLLMTSLVTLNAPEAPLELKDICETEVRNNIGCFLQPSDGYSLFGASRAYMQNKDAIMQSIKAQLPVVRDRLVQEMKDLCQEIRQVETGYNPNLSQETINEFQSKIRDFDAQYHPFLPKPVDHKLYLVFRRELHHQTFPALNELERMCDGQNIIWNIIRLNGADFILTQSRRNIVGYFNPAKKRSEVLNDKEECVVPINRFNHTLCYLLSHMLNDGEEQGDRRWPRDTREELQILHQFFDNKIAIERYSPVPHTFLLHGDVPAEALQAI